MWDRYSVSAAEGRRSPPSSGTHVFPVGHSPGALVYVENSLHCSHRRCSGWDIRSFWKRKPERHQYSWRWMTHGTAVRAGCTTSPSPRAPGHLNRRQLGVARRRTRGSHIRDDTLKPVILRRTKDDGGRDEIGRQGYSDKLTVKSGTRRPDGLGGQQHCWPIKPAVHV